MPKFASVTPILKYLHWLKWNSEFTTKFSLSPTKLFILTSLLTYAPFLPFSIPTNTRSPGLVSPIRPANPSRLKIKHRSLYYGAPVLWNRLSSSVRVRSESLKNDSLSGASRFALSPLQFHTKLKAYLFNQSFPP